MSGTKYNVIYADPPWSYNNKKTGRTNGDQPDGSGAHTKYQTMTNEDIAGMGINAITQKNCICFMWATVPLLPEALFTLKSWGFEYKTMITWRKIMSLGMGYWFRGQCEHLLLGVKGTVKAFRQQKANFYESEVFEVDECFQSKAGKHSQKPHYFRELIETAVKVSFEQPVKLEMFARSRSGLFPRATVTAIKPHQGGYWIYFRNSYREYKTYQERVPDTVFVGKVMTLPIVYRIK